MCTIFPSPPLVSPHSLLLSLSLARAQFSLTPPLAYLFVVKVAIYVSKNLEARLKRKRFTALGALLLDSNLRSLVNFFIERAGSRKIRERFSRLLHICQLVNCDTPAEAAESWSSTRTASTLSGEEVRSVLLLRIGFPAGDVNRLKL